MRTFGTGFIDRMKLQKIPLGRSTSASRRARLTISSEENIPVAPACADIAAFSSMPDADKPDWRRQFESEQEEQLPREDEHE